ncbi:uncharacterized protein LOC114246279 isoform X2 [Bombyx mandarina]|uniref:Uncharacterized protein LOC114246279 isoform X2 n=1 Tax=Bombyx mandarina TaxID=7092 RepID=A0A6J2JYN6_BOMMA|nr:uncharacterized protein LOC114246279 isoform X2 [Bombyx mandarina]
MTADFAKEKVFWTRKMNLKLVKFIESRPYMWNPKDPLYTSISAKDQAYSDFASKYGDEFSWQAVKERWTNIRSTYNNYLRKIKASRTKRDGENTDQIGEHCQYYPDEIEIKSDSEIEPVSLNMDCFSIAESLASVFRGIQHDAFGLENTKHGQIGRAVTRKLNEISSYEAAQMMHKITEILLRYDRSNPINPNNIKAEIT